MSSMTDPMDSLRGLQAAINDRLIKFQICELYPELVMHFDTPNDTPRFTYADLKGSNAQSIAIFVMVEPINGIPCFQMGWATIPEKRGNGLAKNITAKALQELKSGLRRNGKSKFYIEAIVSSSNVESQKIATRLLTEKPKPCQDSFSREDALQYVKLIE